MINRSCVYLANRCRVNSENRCDSWLADRLEFKKFSNGKNLILRKVGFFEAVHKGVTNIFSKLNPLQIIQRVIQWIAVDMVDVFKSPRIWNEFGCENSMNREITPRFTAPVKNGDVEITPAAESWLQRSWFIALSPSAQISNKVSKIGNGISFRINRQRLPYFFYHCGFIC